jgi:hypothetical protein
LIDMFDMALEALEGVLSQKAARSCLEAGLSVQGKIMDTATLEDYRAALRSNVFRQLQVVMPATAAAQLIREVEFQLEQLDNERTEVNSRKDGFPKASSMPQTMVDDGKSTAIRDADLLAMAGSNLLSLNLRTLGSLSVEFTDVLFAERDLKLEVRALRRTLDEGQPIEHQKIEQLRNTLRARRDVLLVEQRAQLEVLDRRIHDLSQRVVVPRELEARLDSARRLLASGTLATSDLRQMERLVENVSGEPVAPAALGAVSVLESEPEVAVPEPIAAESTSVFASEPAALEPVTEHVEPRPELDPEPVLIVEDEPEPVAAVVFEPEPAAAVIEPETEHVTLSEPVVQQASEVIPDDFNGIPSTDSALEITTSEHFEPVVSAQELNAFVPETTDADPVIASVLRSFEPASRFEPSFEMPQIVDEPEVVHAPEPAVVLEPEEVAALEPEPVSAHELEVLAPEPEVLTPELEVVTPEHETPEYAAHEHASHEDLEPEISRLEPEAVHLEHVEAEHIESEHVEAQHVETEEAEPEMFTPEAHLETAIEPDAETEEHHVEAAVVLEPEVEPELEPEPEPEPEAETQAEPEPAVALEPELAASEPESDAQTEAVSLESEHVAAPELEAITEPEFEPVAAVVLEPEPEIQPHTDLEPDRTPETEQPLVEHRPQPVIEPASTIEPDLGAWYAPSLAGTPAESLTRDEAVIAPSYTTNSGFQALREETHVENETASEHSDALVQTREAIANASNEEGIVWLASARRDASSRNADRLRKDPMALKPGRLESEHALAEAEAHVLEAKLHAACDGAGIVHRRLEAEFSLKVAQAAVELASKRVEAVSLRERYGAASKAELEHAQLELERSQEELALARLAEGVVPNVAVGGEPVVNRVEVDAERLKVALQSTPQMLSARHTLERAELELAIRDNPAYPASEISTVRNVVNQAREHFSNLESTLHAELEAALASIRYYGARMSERENGSKTAESELHHAEEGVRQGFVASLTRDESQLKALRADMDKRKAAHKYLEAVHRLQCLTHQYMLG